MGKSMQRTENRFDDPTPVEMALLFEQLMKDQFLEPEKATFMDIVDTAANIAAIGVIRKYITGGPGWSGDPFIISWDGDPSFVSIYGWEGWTEEGQPKWRRFDPTTEENSI